MPLCRVSFEVALWAKRRAPNSVGEHGEALEHRQAISGKALPMPELRGMGYKTFYSLNSLMGPPVFGFRGFMKNRGVHVHLR